MSEAPDLPPLPKLPASHADPSSLAGLSPTQARKLKVGSSCIVWGTLPRPWDDTTLESALEEISAEGLSSFETFPEVLSSWDRRGMLTALMERFGVPLRSGYITGDLTHPEKRKDEIVRITRLAKIIQRFGGSFVVLAPSIVVRETFSFREHREHIVSALNDYAAAITELGLETGLHQHTGTAIESRDEVYAVMEAVNTEILKFAPDVGQIQKGGADAAKVVKDFLPLVKHVHLKDYKGWQFYSGYCPLGMGEVAISEIVDMVEGAGQNPELVIELDPSDEEPMAARETLSTSKAYLESLGYRFHS